MPSVPAKLDPQLSNLLSHLREEAEVGGGTRGDPLQRYIRVGDLIDLGIARALTNRAQQLVSGRTLVSSDTPNLSIPPRPEDFEVTDGFDHVFLDWEPPLRLYSNHAYTEVYRSTVDNLANAPLIATSTSFAVADMNVQYGVTYYYWIRFVSAANIPGPYNATAGTPGQSAQDPAELLARLSGQITTSELALSLASEIELIPTIQSDLAQEVSDRIAAILSLENDMDVVESDITQLEADVSSLESGGSANSSAISALDVRVTANEGNLVSQAADITQLQSDVTDAQNDANANAGAISALITDVASNESEISSQASQLTSLESGVSTINGVLANKNTIFYAASGSPPTALEVNDLWIVSNQGNEARRWNGSSWVSVENTGIAANSSAISSLDSRVTLSEGDITAINSDVTTLQSDVVDLETGAAGTVTALNSLDTRVTITEGSISTQASQISTLTTTVDGHTSSISTLSTVTNGLEAQWEVKTSVGSLIGGVGFYNNGSTTQFLVRANQFAVWSPGASSLSFVVDGSDVVMSGAYIQDATITDAKIDSLSVGKVVGLDATFIQANIGTLYADTIEGDVNKLYSTENTSAVSLINTTGGVIYRRIANVTIPSQTRPRYPLVFSKHVFGFSGSGSATMGVGFFSPNGATANWTFSYSQAAWNTAAAQLSATWYTGSGGVGQNTTAPPANWLEMTAGRYVTFSVTGGTFYGRVSSTSVTGFPGAGGTTATQRIVNFEWGYITGSSIPSSPGSSFSVFTSGNSPLGVEDRTNFFVDRDAAIDTSHSEYLFRLSASSGTESYGVGVASTHSATSEYTRLDILMVR